MARRAPLFCGERLGLDFRRPLLLDDFRNVAQTFTALRTTTAASENFSNRARAAAGGGDFLFPEGVADADIHLAGKSVQRPNDAG